MTEYNSNISKMSLNLRYHDENNDWNAPILTYYYKFHWPFTWIINISTHKTKKLELIFVKQVFYDTAKQLNDKYFEPKWWQIHTLGDCRYVAAQYGVLLTSGPTLSVNINAFY